MHKIKPDNIKYGWGWSHEVLPSRRLSEEKNRSAEPLNV